HYAVRRARRSVPTRRSSDLWCVLPGFTQADPPRMGWIVPSRRTIRTFLMIDGRDDTRCPLRFRYNGSIHASLGIFPLLPGSTPRSEEHTSELQSRENLVCRL